MTVLFNVRDHIRHQGIIPKNIKKVLKLATSIVNTVPQKGDSPIQVVIKLMSIADAVESHLGASRKTQLSEVVDRFNLTTSTNSVFASMFFGTKLHEEFELQRYILDGVVCVEATNPSLGKLLFLQHYEKTYSPTFYHTKDFDFKKVLDRTWELYDGRLQFELQWSKSTFSSFSHVPNPLYGLEAKRLEKMVNRHQRYMAEGMSRAYMFYGAPGTGKTSFAMAFANRIGNRILRIDARSFSTVSSAEITFVIDALQPDFIMVDDIDKADVNYGLSTILSIIQEMKTHKVKTSLLLTANNVGHFDQGLLRPGRIDTWLTFDPPAVEERRRIIRGYLDEARVTLETKVIENFVRLTEDLTQDYLREVAQRLKYEEVDEVIDTLMNMRRLLRKPELPWHADAPSPQLTLHLNGHANGKPAHA